MSFDEQAYLAANPDIVTAIAHGHFASGQEHYEKHGRAEGRDLGLGGGGQPSQQAAPPGFDEQAYLAQNPAVRQAVERGLFESGLDHYLKHGQAEGRSPGFDQASLDRARQIEQHDPLFWKWGQPAEFDGRGNEWNQHRTDMNQALGLNDAGGRSPLGPGYTGVDAAGNTISRGDYYTGHYAGNEQRGAEWMRGMEDYWGHGYFDAPMSQQPSYWDYMQQGFGPGGGNADRPYPGVGGPGGSTPPPGGSTPPPASEPPPSYEPPPSPGGSGETPTTPDRGPGVGPPPPPPPPRNSYLDSVFSSQNGLLASSRRAPTNNRPAPGYDGWHPDGLLANNKYGGR